MKIYSLNKNTVRFDSKADKQWTQSSIISYHATLELVNKAIKTSLYNHIIDKGLINSKNFDKEKLERAKNNQIWIKNKNSELNYDKYPIFFFKEIQVEE